MNPVDIEREAKIALRSLPVADRVRVCSSMILESLRFRQTVSAPEELHLRPLLGAVRHVLGRDGSDAA